MRAFIWLRISFKFPGALLFGYVAGVLAALAYFAVDLVTRLYLHTVGRIADRLGAYALEFIFDVSAWRFVAWRGMDFRVVGCVSRSIPLFGALDSPAVGSAGETIGESVVPMGARGPDLDFSGCLLFMDTFSLAEFG